MLSRRRCTVLIYCIAIIGAMATLVGFTFFRFVYSPMPINQGESVIIRVDKSTTATHLARIMYAQKWIGSMRLWIWWVRLQGLSSRLKAGVYRIQSGESAQHLLHRIISGDVLREQFLIKPGTTQQQVSQDLKSAPYLNYEAQAWLLLTKSYSTAEGLLLADTYAYDAGSSSYDILKQAHTHLEEVLAKAWETRNPALPYQTPYELLIVASILEKEAALSTERRLISGVIVNRLRQHMPLQMDPTVIYALGSSYQGYLKHENMTVDSPYNTYRNRGLPPTPIAMVSADAIDAARDPDIQPYLYFVAKGDGHHAFSNDYATHKQAIKRYMRKS